MNIKELIKNLEREKALTSGLKYATFELNTHEMICDCLNVLKQFEKIRPIEEIQAEIERLEQENADGFTQQVKVNANNQRIWALKWVLNTEGEE